MNINSKLSVYQAQAGAEVSVDKAEADSEYRDSLLGKAMYYGTAAMSGYTMGHELGKTMQPMVDNMKVRRQARRDYNDNALGNYGATTKQGTPYKERPQELEGVNSFRDFYKKTVKNPAKDAMENAGPMETIYNDKGEVIIEGRDRTSNRMADKARVKAFYLNSVTNYEPTGNTTADGAAEFKQVTIARNSMDFYPSMNKPIEIFGKDRSLISLMNQPTTQEEYDEAEENSRFVGESISM